MTYTLERVAMCYQFFTWISSCGTLVALGALIYQMNTDHQLKEWEQAKCVAAWIEDDFIENEHGLFSMIIISNKSDLPIYDVVISRDLVTETVSEMGKGDENCTYFQSVAPGNYKAMIKSNGHGMSHRFNASISFRDANGKYWYRDATGHLRKIKESAIDQRELTRPVMVSNLLEA